MRERTNAHGPCHESVWKRCSQLSTYTLSHGGGIAQQPSFSCPNFVSASKSSANPSGPKYSSAGVRICGESGDKATPSGRGIFCCGA